MPELIVHLKILVRWFGGGFRTMRDSGFSDQVCGCLNTEGVKLLVVAGRVSV